jgi:hypothetical protein
VFESHSKETIMLYVIAVLLVIVIYVNIYNS